MLELKLGLGRAGFTRDFTSVREDNTRYDEFKPAENAWGEKFAKICRALKQTGKALVRPF